ELEPPRDGGRDRNRAAGRPAPRHELRPRTGLLFLAAAGPGARAGAPRSPALDRAVSRPSAGRRPPPARLGDSEGGLAPLPNLPPRNRLRRQSRRSNASMPSRAFLLPA